MSKGKKRYADNVKRRNTISVYLNDQQKENVDRKALESNSSVSDYVRNLIISQ